MKTILFLACVVYTLYSLAKNEEKGIIVFFIMAMIAPNITIRSFTLSFEIVAFLPVVILLYLKNRKIFKIYKKGNFRQSLWFYFFLLLFSSLISTMKYSNSINILALFSYFRIIALIYALYYVFKRSDYLALDKIISTVLFINVIVSIIQLTFPSSINIFLDFYYKDSLTPLLGVYDLGYFSRAYGTFGTPVLLGIFSVFSFSFYMGLLADKLICKKVIVKVGASLSLGLMALSKTVVIGIPAILVLYYVMALFGVIKVKNRKILAFPVLIAPIAILTIKYLEQKGTFIMWYLNFLFKPFESLSTRYSASTGILKDTYSVIFNNLFFGVGLTNVNNTFAGDSMYINILYTTGLIGLVVLIAIMFSPTISIIKARNGTSIMILMSFLMAGFAAPVHVEIIALPFVAYIIVAAETFAIRRRIRKPDHKNSLGPINGISVNEVGET